MAPPVALSSSPPQTTFVSGVQSENADVNDNSYRGYDHVHWYFSSTSCFYILIY